MRTFLPAVLGFMAVLSAAGETQSLHAQNRTYLRQRAIYVEEAVNERPGFFVRVDVDRKDRTYTVGDLVEVTVESEEKGYLYLVYIQANGQQVLLFPNQHQTENRIPAKRRISVPAGNSDFRLRVGEPVGTELLYAIVSEKPLKGEELDQAKSNNYTPIKSARARALFVEPLRQQNQNPGQAEPGERIAEAHIEITTRPSGTSPTQHTVRRVALCVGISDFQDSDIRDLKICHRDAEKFAGMLREHCDFNRVILLRNEQATRSAVSKAIQKTLVEETQPGDEVVIFWSGHGSRIADENGDEADGKDELLVPYDGQVESFAQIKRTMITDDEFGRWIQKLDGRRVVVVLDTCHSGGQAAGQKGILTTANAKTLADPSAKDLSAAETFIDSELKRAKDIGQRNTSVLASSLARQISFERREEDLSVMTYYIVRYVAEHGRVTLETLADYLETEVPRYVEREQPGATQTPVLIDDIEPDFVLR